MIKYSKEFIASQKKVQNKQLEANNANKEKSKILEKGSVKLAIANLKPKEKAVCELYHEKRYPKVICYLMIYYEKSYEEAKGIKYTENIYINASNLATVLFKRNNIKIFIKEIKKRYEKLSNITKKDMLDKYACMFKNNALDSVIIKEYGTLYYKITNKEGKVEYKKAGQSYIMDLSAFENPSKMLKNSVRAIYRTKSGIKITFYNIKEIGQEIARLGGYYEPDKVDFDIQNTDSETNKQVLTLLDTITNRSQEMEPINRLTKELTN